ncbi:MAG: class I SAM-dependent methyltransferase [Lamprobacter sp.]|uniref:class I SAM-dependent methyltransferase n=1 Tax=Lamprobacter sp. TaxID=3100796 RepID=UPI002B25D823|nr:class I SAM-dependent methyltransferase [Lamprobacter sp.]MEA3641774.1 class I SAM-dependent methyltransferase [Lamprobacter sp.]
MHSVQSDAERRWPGSDAEQADRHALYERAVQCPEAEVDFIQQTFLDRRGRPARSLTEDFCGTAAVCREWILRHPEHCAVGVDKDPAVLAYARQHRLASMTADQQRRLRLINADVLEITTPQSAPGLELEAPTSCAPVDLILAMNFSWWLITKRRDLRGYFMRVRERLVADGLFLLDAYGGYDAFRVITEERSIEDDLEPSFSYIWDQADYDPISGLMQCAIHFQFPDGSRLENAFCYRWRLWTLPELREILTEAGFRNLIVYWQGWDENGDPDGCFHPVTRADADAGWICYLSAEP